MHWRTNVCVSARGPPFPLVLCPHARRLSASVGANQTPSLSPIPVSDSSLAPDRCPPTSFASSLSAAPAPCRCCCSLSLWVLQPFRFAEAAAQGAGNEETAHRARNREREGMRTGSRTGSACVCCVAAPLRRSAVVRRKFGRSAARICAAAAAAAAAGAVGWLQTQLAGGNQLAVMRSWCVFCCTAVRGSLPLLARWLP
jgi:hypothetical protein